MKIIALVREEEQAFLMTKTDKIQFCETYAEFEKLLKDQKDNKEVQFVLSNLLAHFKDKAQTIVHNNEDVTFMFYAEPDDFSELPHMHLKTRNFCNEVLNYQELLGVMEGKIGITVKKDGWHDGELRLSKKNKKARE